MHEAFRLLVNGNIPKITPSMSVCPTQNAMPLSSAIFKSEHKNPVPQCPPRLDVQTINAVLWSRMPNTFLKVETARVSERHGWVVQCVEPLQMLAVHIPEENRWSPCTKRLVTLLIHRNLINKSSIQLINIVTSKKCCRVFSPKLSVCILELFYMYFKSFLRNPTILLIFSYFLSKVC